MQEEWRPVLGYEDLYEVSNLGRVRRASRSQHPGRQGGNWPAGRLLAPRINRWGYWQVVLWQNNRQRTHNVHKLVVEAFLGHRPTGYEINHRDCDKANCVLSNLEYVTKSENARHAIAHGRCSDNKGSRHGMAKLSEQAVEHIRSVLDPIPVRKDHSRWGTTRAKMMKALAETYGVSPTQIFRVAARQVWSHVP